MTGILAVSTLALSLLASGAPQEVPDSATRLATRYGIKPE